MDKHKLHGKNIIITGAARGMGAAVSNHFANLGANVCLCDINIDGCEHQVKKIADNNGRAIAVKVDVTNREQIQLAIDSTVEAFGSLDVFINNAGINKPMMFLDITEDNWHKIMNVNGLGCLLGMQQAAKQMKRQGPQKSPYKIINVGSILSRQAFDDVVPYSCSKHAVLGLINGGAKALAKYNITVNGYAPGIVDTELWKQLDKDLVEIGKFDHEGESMEHLAKTMILLERYAEPEDILGTATFLASADSDYMTGQLLMIDGGMVIQ